MPNKYNIIIVTAKAHDKFKTIDYEKLKIENTIVYDVKGKTIYIQDIIYFDMKILKPLQDVFKIYKFIGAWSRMYLIYILGIISSF